MIDFSRYPKGAAPETVAAIMRWVGRHLTLILLFAAIAILGGLRTEQLDTFKAAALAELVALLLSHIALYIFSNDNYHGPEARDARTRIFLAVHLLVGLVYAGSYFVEFAPGI
jgi:hypothetical protein